MPVGILFLDKAYLPVAFPSFKASFTVKCIFYIFIYLKINEPMNAMLLRKSFDIIALMFIDTFNQIGSHTDINDAMLFTCKHIHI